MFVAPIKPEDVHQGDFACLSCGWTGKGIDAVVKMHEPVRCPNTFVSEEGIVSACREPVHLTRMHSTGTLFPNQKQQTWRDRPPML